MFLIFSSQQEAQVACDRIYENIKDFLLIHFPERVSPEGLISINIDGSLDLDATITTEWDSPHKCLEGWAIAKPTQEQLGRVPLAIALAGVEGVELAEITAIDSLPA